MKQIKIVAIILFLLILPVFSKAQIKKRNGVQVEIGVHYSLPIDQSRIEYDPNKLQTPNSSTNDFVSFRLYPTVNYHLGIAYKYQIYKNLFIESGITFFRRSSLFKGIPDTVAKYSKDPNPLVEQKVVKNNLEFPFQLGYIIKNISFNIGTKVTVIDFISNIETNLNGNKNRSHYRNSPPDEYLYPGFAFCYSLCKFKNKPYFSFAVDYRTKKNILDFQITIGMQIFKY